MTSKLLKSITMNHIFIYQFQLFEKKLANLTFLTEVAGEGGPDLTPQKFLSSQKFRHLMG